MHAIVHSADIQDRDGGALLMASWLSSTPTEVTRGRNSRGR